MKAAQIIRHRLANQGLVGAPIGDAEAVVRHFGAMQAQDFYGAKWAIGQRSGTDDAAMDRLFNDGRILRTHLCRPTWHFVLPADIRWILELTKARVHQASAFMHRKQGLDAKQLHKATDLLARALEGGKHLERDELMTVLQRARIDTSDFRSVYFLMHAELEAVICSGPRKGKQFTYALLEERVPAARSFTRAEALAELTVRYFTSRGPASLSDFSLWSGLTMADAKQGIASVADRFAEVPIEGRACWYPKDSDPAKLPANTVHLLPNYDEYGIGYKDRSAFYDAEQARLSGSRNNPVFRHLVVVNGRMLGTWDRTLARKAVAVRSSTFLPLTAAAQRALGAAEKRYARFLGLALER